MKQGYALWGLVALNVLVAAVFLLQTGSGASASASTHAALNVPEQITLLSEVAPSGQEPGDLAAPVGAPARTSLATASPSSSNAAPKLCRIWGPQNSAEAFSDIRSKLDRSGGFPEILTTEISSATDLLVYVSALSVPAAKQYAAELGALGIESYVIQRETDVILSVGVFSQPGRAKRQLNRVAELGYETAIQELPRSQTIYTLRAYIEQDSPLFASSTSDCLTIAQRQ